MSEKEIGPKFEVRRSIRTTTVAEAALESVVHKVKRSKRVGWRKAGKVSQEAIYNAIWLWLDDLPPDVVVEAMTRYVPILRAKMLGEPPGPPIARPAAPPGEGPGTGAGGGFAEGVTRALTDEEVAGRREERDRPQAGEEGG